MKISGAQITAARNLLKITQIELAEASGVSDRTLGKFESDEALPKESTIALIRAELERRGIEFTNGRDRGSPGDGFGVRVNVEKAAAFARGSGQAPKEASR